jgi:hypothetical protein
LANEKSEIILCETEHGPLSISSTSKFMTVDYGIDESPEISSGQIVPDDGVDIEEIFETVEEPDIIDEDDANE